MKKNNRNIRVCAVNNGNRDGFNIYLDFSGQREYLIYDGPDNQQDYILHQRRCLFVAGPRPPLAASMLAERDPLDFMK